MVKAIHLPQSTNLWVFYQSALFTIMWARIGSRCVILRYMRDCLDMKDGHHLNMCTTRTCLRTQMAHSKMYTSSQMLAQKLVTDALWQLDEYINRLPVYAHEQDLFYLVHYLRFLVMHALLDGTQSSEAKKPKSKEIRQTQSGIQPKCTSNKLVPPTKINPIKSRLQR